VHAYRAQMNPHFIFNAFNGKQAAMCYFVERTSSINILPLSPKLICNNFEMSNLDRLSLIDELDYIENYIALQALRLEKAIHTMITIDDTTRL
jgi:LytS/YehU family sensor histidine kinase